MTNILALDTAFGEIAAAVHTASGDFLTTETTKHGKTRSVSIVPVLDDLLAQAGLNWSQLDLLALGAGPGSFTGLRIAAATLAGINSGMKLPILHLSSLAITARQADCDGPIWVLEDARAGEVFAGRYQAGDAVEADCCLGWEEADQTHPESYVCHSEPPIDLKGWQRLPLAVDRSAALLTATLAMAESANVKQQPCYPDPTYLQRSQAERSAYG